jgi:undecaprenyl-diphosphatase
MNILQTILLGVIEGITEFLPISSTAHILLTGKLLDITLADSFTIGIQFGAILAALAISWRSLLHKRVWKLVIWGALPTLVLAYVLYPFLGGIHNNLLVIGLALVLGGIIMILLPLPRDRDPRESIELISMNNRQACMIGFAQVISLIPGVSRSAATIYAGYGLGVATEDAVRYSFVLAIPVMAAATGYSLLQEYQLTGFAGYNWEMLVTGTIVAGLVAYVVMRWLLIFIQRYSWKWFGYYRIILGIIIVYSITR